jgi:hypothetical protein
MARDGSILKQLLSRRSADDIAHAIEGLALLRDRPDECPDTPNCLRGCRGQGLDLRLLWARTDLTPMWTLATRAYWRHVNRRGHGNTIPSLGAILRQIMQT